MQQEAIFAHALTITTEYNSYYLSDLRTFFGSYKTAWGAHEHDIAAALKNMEAAHGIAEKRQAIQLEKEEHILEKLRITLLLQSDASYPSQLCQISFPPPLLYIQGSLPQHMNPALAVVGTRMPTSYGREACRTLVHPVAAAGIPIISGLALGIDTEAHKTALAAKGYTAAIVGSGISRSVLYPSANKRLADEIISAGGALISEYPPLLKATRWTFPQRNRIIAGLASAVLVIEARKKSGTLITARHALEFGRDVCAVPGSIFSTASETPHALIREGAIPVTTPDDVFEALGMEKLLPAKKTLAASLSQEEFKILAILAEPMQANEIARTLHTHISEIQRTLALLEIHGMVRNIGSGIYRKM